MLAIEARLIEISGTDSSAPEISIQTRHEDTALLVDNASHTGVERLRRALTEALMSVPEVEADIPVWWARVYDTYLKAANTFSLESFRKVTKLGIEDQFVVDDALDIETDVRLDNDQLLLLNFLRDIGAIVYFPRGAGALVVPKGESTVVLKNDNLYCAFQSFRTTAMMQRFWKSPTAK